MIREIRSRECPVENHNQGLQACVSVSDKSSLTIITPMVGLFVNGPDCERFSRLHFFLACGLRACSLRVILASLTKPSLSTCIIDIASCSPGVLGRMLELVTGLDSPSSWARHGGVAASTRTGSDESSISVEGESVAHRKPRGISSDAHMNSVKASSILSMLFAACNKES